MERIAFCLPGDGVWTGGVNYVETVCRALLAHPEFGYEPLVFCSPDADHALRTRFERLLGSRLIRELYLTRGRRAGLPAALMLGSNRAMRTLCVRHGCSVMFEAADFYGWRFPVPCLAWVPDFQDRHLPHLFSFAARFRRALGIRLQIAAGRAVLLSSEDARSDCERFYPHARGRTCVARFAVAAALEPGESDPQIAGKYRLPARFFYLPNQFWVHKNHARVIDAVHLLRERRVEIVIAASGNPLDPRHAGHFERLQKKVATLGLDEHFRFLGNVPARDVALLMRASVALLNPSLFEGWSTTVEEGRSLGVRILLSDLRVHREQMGAGAEYFDPHGVQAIGAALEKVWLESPSPPTSDEQRAAAADALSRMRLFAQQFTAACARAADREPVRSADRNV